MLRPYRSALAPTRLKHVSPLFLTSPPRLPLHFPRAFYHLQLSRPALARLHPQTHAAGRCWRFRGASLCICRHHLSARASLPIDLIPSSDLKGFDSEPSSVSCGLSPLSLPISLPSSATQSLQAHLQASPVRPRITANVFSLCNPPTNASSSSSSSSSSASSRRSLLPLVAVDPPSNKCPVVWVQDVDRLCASPLSAPIHPFPVCSCVPPNFSPLSALPPAFPPSPPAPCSQNVTRLAKACASADTACSRCASTLSAAAAALARYSPAVAARTAARGSAGNASMAAGEPTTAPSEAVMDDCARVTFVRVAQAQVRLSRRVPSFLSLCAYRVACKTTTAPSEAVMDDCGRVTFVRVTQAQVRLYLVVCPPLAVYVLPLCASAIREGGPGPSTFLHLYSSSFCPPFLGAARP
ncbi:unnamed protein product [Closterium sp. NIES-65]|nr:unnamed protein product [Closterium sp. NIES-65]